MRVAANGTVLYPHGTLGPEKKMVEMLVTFFNDSLLKDIG